MKVIKIVDGKVVAVSTTSIRPSDSSWVIVDDNAEYYVGQDVSGVGEKRSDADVKSLIKAVAETEALYKAKSVEMKQVADELSRAKTEQADLISKLALATAKTDDAQRKYNTINDSVLALGSALAERKRMADVATEELLKSRAQDAADAAYKAAMDKAKADLNADVLKTGSGSDKKVSGSSQKGADVPEAGQKA